VAPDGVGAVLDAAGHGDQLIAVHFGAPQQRIVPIVDMSLVPLSVGGGPAVTVRPRVWRSCSAVTVQGMNSFAADLRLCRDIGAARRHRRWAPALATGDYGAVYLVVLGVA
jgi:hypothetical protein